MKKYPTQLELEAIYLFYQEGKTRAEITELLEARDMLKNFNPVG